MLKKIFAFLFSTFSLFSNQSNQSKIAHVNGIDIWYETFGEKENPAVLLIMGGCCQGVIWDKGFCERLADTGFYVIRYDHRDTGLSTCFDFEKDPYSLMDMTKDAVGVLDVTGVKKAYLFGISMGSAIAETLAGYFPERVYSILLMGSSCDIHPMNLAYAGFLPEENAKFSPPSPEYLAWMKEFMKLSPKTEEEKLAFRIEGWNKLNGNKIPLNEKINVEIHTAFLSRLRYPQGIINHIKMLKDERSEDLVRSLPAKIKVPTVIIHGTEDPIFPPDHGKALHQAIKGSEYFLVEGMGHIPNDHFYDFYIDILKRQASKLGDTMNDEWLTLIKKTTPSSGQFKAKDEKDTPIVVEWKRGDILSSDLAQFKKSVSTLASEELSSLELQFLRANPDAMSSDPFLSPCASLLENDVEFVNWQKVEEKIQETIKQFYLMDLSKFGPEVIRPLKDDVYFFATVKNKDEDQISGFILFAITPALAYGDIKVINLLVSKKEENRGLEKVLTSLIFKIIPGTKRIFLLVRPTSENLIHKYHSLGFVTNLNPLQDPNHKINIKYYIPLEYKIEKSDNPLYKNESSFAH